MRLARGLLFVLVWLALLDFPHESVAEELDASWIRCLGYFLTQGYQCGTDWVWTYGPLGYFVHNIYYPDLFWQKFAWEFAVKFAFTWLFLRWADLLPSWGTRVVFLGMVLLFLAGIRDELYLFALVVMGLLPLRDPRCRQPGLLAAGTLLLAVLVLTKFTFLLVGVAAWLILILPPVLHPRRRIALGLGFPALVALLWLTLGQSLGNFLSFLSGTLEVAQGYGEAMAMPDILRKLRLALMGIALFLAVPLVYPRSLFRRCGNWLGLALVGFSFFLVWKHGFTRQRSHAVHFFDYLPLVPFALDGLFGDETAERWRQPIRTWGSVRAFCLRAAWMTGLIYLGIHGHDSLPAFDLLYHRIYANATNAATPLALHRALQEQHDAQAAVWSLPAVQRLVNRQAVDQISTAQGVLLINGMNYHPRPAFQSYAAYTPGLLARNAAFYRSEHAPAFVLCKLSPIDQHLAAMEDGPALLEILRRYHPVLSEKGFVLLKRRPDSEILRAVERPVLLQRTIRFGEEVRVDELGSMPKTLALHIEQSPLGWLANTFFRPPPLFLELRTSDGETNYYRLIPGMAGGDFLLDPLLRNNADLLDLYANRALPRVEAFSVYAAPEAPACYRDRMAIVVRSEPGLMQGAAADGKDRRPHD